MPRTGAGSALQIDIVSDVMCPWCVIGYLQLNRTLKAADQAVRLRWHPFELNPDMPPEGQNLREHIMRKYGSTEVQSRQMRDRLTAMGADLGFAFSFGAESRIVNTFPAHQLLDWAETQGRQHPLKLALFVAYFTHGRDVSDPEVLADTAGTPGSTPTPRARHWHRAPMQRRCARNRGSGPAAASAAYRRWSSPANTC